MAHRYLAPAGTPLLVGDDVRLVGEEARHAAAVARIRVGESTEVGDGRGVVADAAVLEVARDAVLLRLEAVRMEAEPVPRILLVQALAKGGRDEMAIQAATELGVAAVAPWQATRSVTRWTGAKAESGAARWGSIVREAAKQAKRAWVPDALGLLSTEGVAALAGDRRLVVLDPEGPIRLVDAVPADEGGDLALVVGPEGGVAPDEFARFESAGGISARLGRHVLRTSTAGPAALAALAVHLDLWP